MSPRELIDWTLVNSGRPGIEELEQHKWIDVQPSFDDSHFLNGFGHKDGKYRFAAHWHECKHKKHTGTMGPVDAMPSFPDHWAVIHEADETHPFRLGHQPGADLPQLIVQRNPIVDEARGPPAGADAPGRHGAQWP
jgi:hypothetical protein